MPLKSKLALLLVLSSAFGAFGWFWWSAVHRSEIGFLPTRPGAEWIIYPKAAEGRIHPQIKLGTVFARSFVLEEVPENPNLKIAGFHAYSVLLNGKPLDKPQQRGKSWKSPDLFDPSNVLRRGTNEIAVTVSNTNGPPALWLLLKAGNFSLKTDETWRASQAGAVWQSAQLAEEPLPIPAGNGLYGGDTPGRSFLKRWPVLLLFAAVSSAMTLFITRRQSVEAGDSRFDEWFLVSVLAAIWIAIFANNITVLPGSVGYDTSGHRDYIDYIETHWSLPLANEGWEMFQPPLYYLVCAALLKLFLLTIRDWAGVVVVRLFGLATGIVHFIIVWKSLRLLFPENPARQKWGLLLAACLPPGLFLSHYISNEALAAVLVSGSVYLCLRILKEEQPSWKSFVGLGLCLGAALLTKSTTVLALPPIFGAFVWKAVQGRTACSQEAPVLKIGMQGSDAGKIIIVVALCILVSGWHYSRSWYHFGSPFVGVWDPRTGFHWWQDDGFRTAAFYLRFGKVFFHPWFSALHGFADGFYSTLWGDGLMGGSDSLAGPPWNFDLMVLAYWLALVPTLGVIIGAFFAIRRFVRQPSPEWVLILGLGFLIAFAVTYMSMTIPYYCVVKAFYGYSGVIPFCAFGAFGLERITGPAKRGAGVENQRSAVKIQRLSATLCCVLIGVWALTSVASYWIMHSSVPTLLAKVADVMRENRPLEAQQLLEQRLALEPENRRVRTELAKVLIVTKNEEQALREAAAVAKAAPDDPQNLTTLAMAVASTNPDRAIEEAKRAIKIAPGYTLALQQLATLHQLQGHYTEAEEAAREGLALEPCNAGFSERLGEVLVRKGQIPEGIALLKTACQMRPDNVWARCALADAYELQHDTPNAIGEYSEVLRLQPDFPNALNNLAWLRATNPHRELRDGAEAVRLAERACQVTGDREAMFIGTLAAAYAEAGRYEEAVKTATQARDLARASGQQELARKNEELIGLFTAHQPYRQAHE
jgi:tetratricopeptide (TPR) repeat protein